MHFLKCLLYLVIFFISSLSKDWKLTLPAAVNCQQLLRQGRDFLSLSIIPARILTDLTLCRSSASGHSHCAHEYNSPVMSRKTIFLQVPTTSGSYHLCSLSSVMLLSLLGKEYDIGVLFRVQYTAVFYSLCAGQVVNLCINFHLPPKRGGGASLMRVEGSTNL